ncbi:MAG: IS1634 family transposase [Candidatus Scalindua sp.]
MLIITQHYTFVNMIIQEGLKSDVIHKKHVIGAHPIIQYFIDRLRIDEIIGSYVKQDKRIKLSTEKTLSVLIHNILTTHLPMYEITDWLKPLDEEKIGLDIGESSLITDDRLGKSLESLYNGRHKDIFFRLALRAIKLFEIDCRQIHQDTTTVTFSGKYEGWYAQQIMTHGINKDHRPDLKQLVLGMSVTVDGAVPLVHEIYDGNQTDDRLHPANHRRLRRLLQRSDFIYVADSKLATDDNLRKITACGGLFVSVMPRTWKEDKMFRDKVRKGKVKWKHILSRPNNRKPKSKRDRYYLAKGQYKTSNGYKLFWILSTQKAEQDAETRERNIEKTIDALKYLQSRINTYSLKSHENIKKKIVSILKENKCGNFIKCNIYRETRNEVQHKKVGRPKLKEIGKPVIKEYFSVDFRIDEERIKKESLTDGIFPLITNLKDHKPKKVLEIYKYQPFLEKRNSQLKTYQQIAPVFLKKAQRVIAYLHMNVMALMVATLIERQLRIAMKRKAIKALPIYPEGRPCKYPTTFDIVRLFKGIERYEVVQGENIYIFPAKLNKIQKQVIELLGVPVSLYQ